MPIPPRPIPTNRNARPGTSVHRKTPLSFDKSDWRSELTYLSDRPASLPAHNGVKLIDQAKFEKASRKNEVDETAGKREVGLEGLIVDGKGKREKRATTAATLGFDFIPNPSIVALPNDLPIKASLLTTSLKYKTKLGSVPDTGRISPALSGTPTTPALLPGTGDDEVEDLGDDDWEHVGRDEESEDSICKDVGEDDGDLCVLGELELEDAAGQVSKIPENGTGKEGVSYAAAAIGARPLKAGI